MMDNFFSKRGIPIKLCLFRALVVLSQLRQEVAGHNPVTTEIIIKALYIKSYEARVVIFFSADHIDVFRTYNTTHTSHNIVASALFNSTFLP